MNYKFGALKWVHMNTDMNVTPKIHRKDTMKMEAQRPSETLALSHYTTLQPVNRVTSNLKLSTLNS